MEGLQRLVFSILRFNFSLSGTSFNMTEILLTGTLSLNSINPMMKVDAMLSSEYYNHATSRLAKRQFGDIADM